MIEQILRPYIPERFVSDARYRRGHIRVINPLPGTRVLGLHIPDMRKAAAELTSSADRTTELIRLFEAAPERSLYYEEYMVWGMMLNRMKMPLEERLETGCIRSPYRQLGRVRQCLRRCQVGPPG